MANATLTLNQADAKAKQKILGDQLVIAQLQAKLQSDQVQIAIQTLAALGAIAAGLKQGSSAQASAAADTALVASDNAAIAAATAQMGQDQNAEALLAAQNTQTLDTMNANIANLQQQAQITANKWDQQLANDKAQISSLQKMATSQSSTSASSSSSVAAGLGTSSNPMTVKSPSLAQQQNTQIQQLQATNKTLQAQLTVAQQQLAWMQAQVSALQELTGLVQEGVGVDVSSDRGMSAALKAVEAHGAVHA